MSDLASPIITQSIANGVLAVPEGSQVGHPPFGDFGRLLTEAAFRADTFNLAHLSKGFPAIAYAVYLYKTIPDGRDTLIEIAKGERDPLPTTTSAVARPWAVTRDQVSG